MKTVLALMFVFGLVAITIADSEDDSLWKRLNLEPEAVNSDEEKTEEQEQTTGNKEFKRRAVFCNKKCNWVNECTTKFEKCQCSGFYTARKCKSMCPVKVCVSKKQCPPGCNGNSNGNW